MRTGLTLRIAAMLVALACVAGIAACGDDDSGGGGGGDGGPTTLKVGVIPIADVAPLYLGMKQGFFEDEQLTIEPQLAEGGAAITPGRRERRLPDRLLQHDLAADRRVAEPAGPDHQPGRVGRGLGEGRLGRPPRAEERPGQDHQGPRGQDDRRQHAEEHLRGHDQGVAREGRRRRGLAQVRRGAVPRHERRARRRARGRRLRRRAVREPGQGRQVEGRQPVLRAHGARTSRSRPTSRRSSTRRRTPTWSTVS